jgi:hypothetical protein
MNTEIDLAGSRGGLIEVLRGCLLGKTEENRRRKRSG